MAVGLGNGLCVHVPVSEAEELRCGLVTSRIQKVDGLGFNKSGLALIIRIGPGQGGRHPFPPSKPATKLWVLFIEGGYLLGSPPGGNPLSLAPRYIEGGQDGVQSNHGARSHSERAGRSITQLLHTYNANLPTKPPRPQWPHSRIRFPSSIYSTILTKN